MKRILCGALSLAMCSTLAIESTLRIFSDGDAGSTTVVTASAQEKFKNVTGTYDTSTLQQSYFNDSVLKSEETTPVYETRTVIVTLASDPIIDRVEDTSVSEYINTWAGERAKSEISKEQTAFLQALKKKGISYELDRTYDTVLNGVAIKINTKYVAAIKEMKGVTSAVITTAFAEPKLAETQSSNSNLVYNETDVYETGIYDSSAYAAEYGAGTVVAVLDTGLDYTHSAFQNFQNDQVKYAWDREHIKNELLLKDLAAEQRSGALEAADVYVSAKVPFAYDYADDDPDVYPSYSNHGTHVAGIIGGYDPNGYTDKDGNPIDKDFLGVVPDAQLMICKVFTDDLDDPDLGGAVSEDIVAALDDCVTLGVDVINMSLGSSCGFTTTNDGDDEGDMLNRVYTRVANSGISLICAASNDYSAGYGGVYGTNLASNPDAGTVGSPSTYPGALSVASINGQQASYFVANAGTDNESYVYFEESRDINSNAFDFVAQLNEKYPENEGVFEYVVVPGVGHAADYVTNIQKLFKEKGRIALIKRGDTTFMDKVKIAMEMGAIGVIVYNNVAGMIRMNLGEIEDPIPAVSISMNAGNAMASEEIGKVGTIEINATYAAGPFMSEFSSWGPTPDLKLKPEITAHGGEITSAVPGGYGEQSGTSMATPNMAGFMAIVRGYIKKDLGITDPVAINRLAMQLTMSTAGTVYDQDGLPYSPRKQGAGVAKLGNIVGDGGTKAYLYTDVAENDYRPKYELGDDPEKNGEYTIKFFISNFRGNEELSFKLEQEFMTETLSSDRLTVSEQAYMLNKSSSSWKVNGKEKNTGDVITVAAGENVEISLTLTLGEQDRAYIEKSFENGMYVEGFVKLLSQTSGQCDLTLPFLGFYGDWDQAPMLDYSAYEVAENEQDASILEEDKIQASIWETQPYNIYYNDKYVLPMGGYLYLLPDDADPMYVDEEHNAVSRYNEYYGEGNVENYMTTTGLKAVYAGLLRNARVVKYKLYDESTGEVILESEINRVSKAYSGGGSAVPANVKLELYPEEEGWIANGRYRMEFEFFKDDPEAGEVAREEDTFAFSFTVDYEAPIMEDARVRFYNYTDESNKEKQRVYLDVDVYDNHYAQTLMLCYPKTASNGDVSLQLLTDYPTPIRNAVKNGITTVTIEITDIYEEYGDQLYVQIDDYALNTCLYQININEANADVLPEGGEFDLAAGESEISLDIYQTHKSVLVYKDSYTGEADAANFLWTSANPRIADVKNGEIVGRSKGTTKIFVSNRKGGTKEITVTVSDVVCETLVKTPSISLGIIQTDSDSLQKADGNVDVSAGDTIKMSVITDPWYHPMTDLKIEWTSTNSSVASVDQNGVVTTLKKGSANISATIWKKNADGKWERTQYAAVSYMHVQDEFTVSNYTLTKYSGVGYNAEDGYELEDGVLKIPTDLNIMYIGSEAFEDNDNIKKIIIPSSVVEIQERAFYNCTALEEVYFVSEEAQDIADADLSMIYEQAFAGCVNLKKIDFSNVKTITVAADCFSGCTNLTEVVDMPSIGTMHHRAFAGTALTSVDLTGLHMSGNNVFEGCKNLTSIQTGKFTAIGNYMFKDCTELRNQVIIHTPKIGTGAFSGCVNLAGVKFQSLEGTSMEFDIGGKAFENCGKNLRGSFVVDFGEEYIRSIGERAFAGSSLKTLDFGGICGLEILGSNAFANTKVTEIVLADGLNLETLRVTGIPFEGLTVTVAEGSNHYVDENGVIYNANKSRILYVNSSFTGTDGKFTLPETVTSIADYAFANSTLKELVFTEKVTSIGIGSFKNAKISSIDFADAALTEIPASAFEGSAITSVVLPDGVSILGNNAFARSAVSSFKADGLQTIGDSAFEGCSALEKIVLADGVKEMGSYVFYQCTALTEATLPSLEKLGVYTFFGASALKKATFGSEAMTTGTYTFARTPIENVTFGNAIKRIEEGVFYECTSLKAITLPSSVISVDDVAFNGCTALETVNGIERIESFGQQSFYNVPLAELKLTAAKRIGYMAFAAYEASVDSSKTATYTSISMPTVEVIESYAFFNGGESEVALPATVKSVGAAAFASSNNLSTVTIDEANPYFFVEDNVLYRYTGKSEYELVSYPTARVVAEVEGKRTYSVLVGTVRIMAYAFYNLNANTVNAVVLPYTVNSIGDSAFFESGVYEYTFESIQAPNLESSYRSEVRDVIKEQSTIAEYKGYYNTNFQTYLYHFTKFGNEVSNLVLNYPSNGKGYDNPIYTMYFGVRNASSEALIEDETRLCLEMIEGMYTAEEVETWLTWEKTEENKQKVIDFAETLKTARTYYNNAAGNAGQAAYLTEELENKLIAVEEALRSVKGYFEIYVGVSEIIIASDSTHRTEYFVGEVFDMSGLKLIAIYDDFSQAEIDINDVILSTDRALRLSDRKVEVMYDGVFGTIPVKVKEKQEPVDSSEENSSVEEESSEETSADSSAASGKKGGCNGSVANAITATALLFVGAAVVATVRKKKSNQD